MDFGHYLRRWMARRARRAEFRREFERFAALAGADDRFSVRWQDRHPCLDERTATTAFDRHYVYHTAWAARVLARTRPARHVDIASSLYFCALVSAFVPVEFYDARPADLVLDNLRSGRADLLHLPFADASLPSLSCMHVVEHIGLGRYGDPLDPRADLAAAAELRRVLAPGGDLLVVVPVGRPRVQFNAHRVYAYGHVTRMFAGLHLVEYALIPDEPARGHLLVGASEALSDAQSYGGGCFWFRAA